MYDLFSGEEAGEKGEQAAVELGGEKGKKKEEKKKKGRGLKRLALYGFDVGIHDIKMMLQDVGSFLFSFPLFLDADSLRFCIVPQDARDASPLSPRSQFQPLRVRIDDAQLWQQAHRCVSFTSSSSRRTDLITSRSSRPLLPSDLVPCRPSW